MGTPSEQERSPAEANREPLPPANSGRSVLFLVASVGPATHPRAASREADGIRRRPRIARSLWMHRDASREPSSTGFGIDAVPAKRFGAPVDQGVSGYPSLEQRKQRGDRHLSAPCKASCRASRSNAVGESAL